MSDTYKHYLRDLGMLIREQALQARKDADSAAADDLPFQLGQSTSYYVVTTLMLQQADAFGLSPDDVGLAGLNPDQDLLGPNKPDTMTE
ncbi:MAG: hypothetical protein GY880_09680 [Planctomycetaceae bacterium]|nr:hypothetical protein [Planctomycetaceae bacterium]